jgi:peptide/nickel transport system substrate-binding protein
MSRDIDHTNGPAKALSRRQWLAMLGVGGTGALAGCTGDGGGDDDNQTGNGDDNQTGNGDDNATGNGGDGMGNGDDNATGNGGDGTGNGGDGTGNGDDNGDQFQFPERAASYNTNVSGSFGTLNVLFNEESSAGTAIGRTMDNGYTFDEEEQLVPLLYDLNSEDNEVWVFDLRENLQFSDPYGQVTGETYEYYINEVVQSGWAEHTAATSWTGLNVEQTGEFQFQVELQNPRFLYPESFDPLLYPVPQGLLEQYVPDEDREGLQQDEELLELQFTGNLGPYTLDAWNRGSGTTYTRNDDYYLAELVSNGNTSYDFGRLWEQAPYFDAAEISVVPEQSSRLAQLETGEAASAAIPASQFASYQDNPDVRALQIPQSFNNALALNMRDNGWRTGPGNLFRYDAFRQAMAMAIDKEALIQGVYNGLAEPHYTWQPSYTQWYPGDENLQTWGTGDLYGEEVAKERAQQAFDESEFDYGFAGNGDMVTPDGNQCQMDIYTSQGQETENNAANFCAQELGDNLGLDVTVETIDGGTFQNQYFRQQVPEGEEAPDYSAFFNAGPRSFTSQEAWDSALVFSFNTYPRNPITSSAFFDGYEASTNAVAYQPGFDAQGLYDQIEMAENREEITQLFQELFINLNEEQPYIMLTFDSSLTGYRPDLVGPIENFANGWNFPTWYFEQS